MIVNASVFLTLTGFSIKEEQKILVVLILKYHPNMVSHDKTYGE